MGNASIRADRNSAQERDTGGNLALELPRHLQKPRLRRWEASEYMAFVHGITVAPATLAKLASVGGGPGFHRVGRIPLYPRDELDRWATEKLGCMVMSTTEVKR